MCYNIKPGEKMRNVRKMIIKDLDKMKTGERITLPLDLLEKVVFDILSFRNSNHELVEVKSIALSNEHLRKLDLSKLDFTDVDVMAFNLSNINATKSS